jgi:hypothetical protein
MVPKRRCEVISALKFLAFGRVTETDSVLPEVCQPRFAANLSVLSFTLRSGAPMSTPEPKCPHRRTQLIAKDDDAQYIECLDCGEILEVGELKDKNEFNESLSDA